MTKLKEFSFKVREYTNKEIFGTLEVAFADDFEYSTGILGSKYECMIQILAELGIINREINRLQNDDRRALAAILEHNLLAVNEVASHMKVYYKELV